MNLSELTKLPKELFNKHSQCVIETCINGIKTSVLHLHDDNGDYLAILATDKSLSKICGQIILNHLINIVAYDTYEGNVVIIKAYY